MPLHNPPAGQIPTRVLYVTVITRTKTGINRPIDEGAGDSLAPLINDRLAGVTTSCGIGWRESAKVSFPIPMHGTVRGGTFPVPQGWWQELSPCPLEVIRGTR